MEITVSIIHYQFLVSDKKCGGILTEKTFILASPNYPGYYPRDTACLWVVRIPNAKGFRMRFQEPFNVGNPDTGSGCQDYLLTFRDSRYPSTYDPIVECGNEVREKYFEGEEVWIEFRSNGQGRFQGFRALYTALFESFTTPAPGPQIGKGNLFYYFITSDPTLVQSLQKVEKATCGRREEGEGV